MRACLFKQPSASICYANSAIQVLFHCLPLRNAILNYKPPSQDPNKDRQREANANNNNNGGAGGSDAGGIMNGFGGGGGSREHDMLYELHVLFKQLVNNKKQRGAFSHKRFILALKATNALFDNDDHHDSHEFINWLLDKVHEDYIKSAQAQQQ